MPTSTTIHTHRLTGPGAAATIDWALSILRPHLPASIATYRRLQFCRSLADPSTLLTNLPLAGGDRAGGGEGEDGGAWIIAVVNRSRRPETEAWWYGSWEAGGRAEEDEEKEKEEEEIAGVLWALCGAIRSFEVPVSVHGKLLGGDDDVRDHTGLSRADYAAHMRNSDIILCGAIHERSLPTLRRTGLVKILFEGEHVKFVPNHTFVFDLDTAVPTEVKDLPEGLSWGELSYEHFATVRARTQIPRQDKTLAMLPNLAINAGEVPVAWAFVGLDGSLTSLHVEEQWRGKGLAKALTIKLFREKMDFLWEEGVAKLAHGHVIHGNQQSVHLCRSIGGKPQWDAYWVRIDLGVLR